MLPFGKQQDILDFLFDDKSRSAVGKPPGTLFIEDGAPPRPLATLSAHP
jgi:hypothetical protein